LTKAGPVFDALDREGAETGANSGNPYPFAHRWTTALPKKALSIERSAVVGSVEFVSRCQSARAALCYHRGFVAHHGELSDVGLNRFVASSFSCLPVRSGHQ